MLDPKLHDEPARLAALHRYEVLDTPSEPAFERITGLVQAVLGVPISTVSLIDGDRQWYKSCTGIDNEQLPREQSFCTYTIQSREPMIVPDTRLDPRFAAYPSVTREDGIRSYVGVPLCTPDGYNLGSLCALDRVPRDFAPAQIEVLKSFAALVVDELELRRIAQTDTLTGAATRRSFLLELDKTLARYRCHGTPATLLLLDVDHFKRVNDTYGHPAGDQVLTAISHTLSSLLQKDDLVGRLGGEEFGVLLAGIDLCRAVETAGRLHRAIEQLELTAREPFHVTGSFGIAAADGTLADSGDWLARADAALYEAKHAGRNCCRCSLTSAITDERLTPA